jgi:hypothetical protein
MSRPSAAVPDRPALIQAQAPARRSGRGFPVGRDHGSQGARSIVVSPTLKHLEGAEFARPGSFRNTLDNCLNFILADAYRAF